MRLRPGRLFGIALLCALALATPGCHTTESTSADEEHRDAPPGREAHDEQGHAGDDHGHAAEEGHKFTPEEMERFGVTIETAEAGTIDLSVELPGEVRPNEDRLAHIAPRFPGLVREVRKRVGDTVRAGDVLAVIESEALATYDLKAAFDGTIIDKRITPGEAVSRDVLAFTIADLNNVWVDMSVYQKDLAYVRPGQPVLVTAGKGLAEATGTISYVTPVIDPSTRTATARVVLPNSDGKWRPGLFVTAHVLQPESGAVVVSKDGIHTFEGKTVVFVATDHAFEPRPVSLGRMGRTKVEVLSGLSKGERYAGANSFLVKAELGKGEAEHED
jgi:cobalt-zinc-cadmium efflux system membrane fusion protein